MSNLSTSALTSLPLVVYAQDRAVRSRRDLKDGPSYTAVLGASTVIQGFSRRKSIALAMRIFLGRKKFT